MAAESKKYFYLFFIDANSPGKAGRKQYLLASKAAIPDEDMMAIRALFASSKRGIRKPGRKEYRMFLTVTAAVVLFWFLFNKAGDALNKWARTAFPPSPFFNHQYKMSKEYSDLFSDSALRKLQDFYPSTNNDHPFTDSNPQPASARDTIFCVDYDSSYNILIRKINLSAPTPLNQLIKQRVGGTGGALVFYRVTTASLFELCWLAKQQTTVSSVILTFSDPEDTLVFKNDTVACCRLETGDFSIKYHADSNVNLYIHSRENAFFQTEFSKELLFKRKGDDLFVMVMAPRDHDVTMPEHLLFDITNKN